MKLQRVLGVVGILIALSAGVVLAGENYDRRFTRISFIEGNVVFRHSADSDWSAGSINTPLQEQDRVYVPLNSRCEIEFDDGSFLRMAEDTEVRILRLDQALIQVELPIGLTTIRFTSEVSFGVESPAGSVRLLEKGVYRLEVPRDGSLDVSVRKGTAEVVRANETARIRRGEAIYVPVDAGAQARLRPTDREDAWDTWNDRRDATALASVSRRYLPNDVYMGTYELDRYGTWVSVADYGYGWRPLSVSYGWSPYRSGRWIYRPFWGWTWVSYEPWGWLPYHYGRWYYDPIYRWCWVPRSGFGFSFNFGFWSPGLVRFYRYRDGLSWVPLGPRDYYNPHNYFYNVNNITYNNYFTNIQNTTLERLPRDRRPQNMDVDGALVSISQQGFITGRDTERQRIPAREVASMGTPVGSLRDIDIKPTAESRSPRPDVDVRRLGLVDLRRDASGTDSPANAVHPSIRSLVPGESIRDDRQPVSRDVNRDNRTAPDQLSPSREGTSSIPVERRAISGGRRQEASAGVRDRLPGGSGSEVQVASPERRVVPGEGRYSGDSLRTAPPQNRDSVTIGGRNNVPTVSPERRVVPGEGRTFEPSRPTERSLPPNDNPNASPHRRVLPGENRTFEPAVRTSPSVESPGRDMDRVGPSPTGYPQPRVRVFTPENSAPRTGSPPVYVVPGRRGETGPDVKPPSMDRPQRFPTPQERDRPRISPSAPPSAGPGTVTRIPVERRPPPERKPAPPR